ncbi:MAG: PLP-dependent aminotransferase family protein [Rhizobiaceae bacterium]
MTNAIFLSQSIDADAPEPLFQQIYEGMSQLIITGKLQPGARLPATRTFAAELGVSRSTVVTAYDQLVAEGYGEARAGAGIFVCDVGAFTAIGKPQKPATSRPSKPLPRQPRYFEPGVPDMKLFPYDAWGRHVSRSARSSTPEIITNGDTFGNMRLRQAIASHLSQWRGIEAAPEQILVTAGARSAFEITMRALTKPGQVIALEDPGYGPMRRVALSLGLSPLWMKIGEQGAECPENYKTAPILTILTPSHQFPLGGAMPTGQRNRFLAFAEQTGGWIIEDDFDSEFRYAGRPIPALAALDHLQRVIYIGTFSKVFSAGLRLGYMVVPEQLLSVFNRILEDFGVATSVVPQLPLATFMEDGEFHRHLRRMRRTYGARRRAFVELLHSELGKIASHKNHLAGMQIALELSKNADDVAISKEAKVQNIVCPPLSAFYAGSHGQPGLLMGYSSISPEEMLAPLQMLSKIIQKHGR